MKKTDDLTQYLISFLFNSILGEQDYCGSQPDPEKRTIITTNQANKDEALYEEIDESKIKNDTNTYTFKHIGKMIFIMTVLRQWLVEVRLEVQHSNSKVYI